MAKSQDAAIAELLDERAICKVVLRYCRGVDRMDRELVRSCFHDDAEDQHGNFRGNVDELLDWMWKILARYDSPNPPGSFRDVAPTAMYPRSSTC